MYRVSPDYFQAAGTALLAGRALTWHDDKTMPRVALINQDVDPGDDRRRTADGGRLRRTANQSGPHRLKCLAGSRSALPST